MGDRENKATPKNIDRLLSQLTNGTIAHRLAAARKAAMTDTEAVDSLKRVLEDRAEELRKQYEPGQNNKD